MLRACPPLLCAQVAATAQGSRKSKAMAAWPGALQTRACPSHAPSSQCSAPWKNASTWGLLLGSGHQVGLRGNTDHSNRLSSSQLPFQSSEYLKTEGLGAPVMLARKHPLRLLLFPGQDSGLRGSRACGARQGAVCRPCSAFTAFTVVSLSVPAYGKQDWSPFMAVKTVAKIRKQGHYKEKVLYACGAQIRPVERSVALGRPFPLCLRFLTSTSWGRGREAEGALVSK